MRLRKTKKQTEECNAEVSGPYPKMALPLALICILASRNAYARQDGVHIVPIGSLGDRNLKLSILNIGRVVTFIVPIEPCYIC